MPENARPVQAVFCRRRYQPKRPPIATDRAAPNSRKSETIAARRPNSFSARSVVFEPPGCLPSPLPETGLVAAGLCSVETGRPFKEQLALTAVACMPDEHSVPALMAVALRSATAWSGRQREGYARRCFRSDPAARQIQGAFRSGHEYQSAGMQDIFATGHRMAKSRSESPGCLG